MYAHALVDTRVMEIAPEFGDTSMEGNLVEVVLQTVGGKPLWGGLARSIGLLQDLLSSPGATRFGLRDLSLWPNGIRVRARLKDRSRLPELMDFLREKTAPDIPLNDE